MAGIERMVASSGMTTRQIDHWTRRGYLRPVNADCGAGYARDWSLAEVRVAEVMGRLVRGGMTPEAACRVARGGELAPGITITIGPEPPTA